MSKEEKIGYANPPKSTRWQKGQSGNPRGRPKSKSEVMVDAARILTQPVDARTRDGRTVRLDAIEAPYLALCRNGLKGHKPSLLEAIRIMLDVGPAVQAKENENRMKEQRVIELLERMGVKIPEDSKYRE
ncbi:DUF5681 domain-containing protein [Ruegeria arenilitoris]|uniref:DUF5681 domain-containing protein n=1 Tax=Ruegeria arenilitoris TaxID=1173585 RepID=UPI00147D6B92|nr:DUF5681 domain-containing protein [Ruegeria arenilitoris]